MLMSGPPVKRMALHQGLGSGSQCQSCSLGPAWHRKWGIGSMDLGLGKKAKELKSSSSHTSGPASPDVLGTSTSEPDSLGDQWQHILRPRVLGYLLLITTHHSLSPGPYCSTCHGEPPASNCSSSSFSSGIPKVHGVVIAVLVVRKQSSFP